MNEVECQPCYEHGHTKCVCGTSQRDKLMTDVVRAVRPFAKKQLFIEGYESEFRRVVDALAALDSFEASK